jgi:6-pyruvoyltetrahydropterin/6-carboxytetrahydropterin synthase
MFQSTKRYGHEVGLSCAFRQWRAHSHCRLLHGYALAFKFVFATKDDDLEICGWVVDFGGLKDLKGILEDTFDHTTVVAADDPEIEWFREGQARGVLRLVEVDAGGCERFAKLVYEVAAQWLRDAGYGDRVKLVSVEVSEHGANSALYIGDANE